MAGYLYHGFPSARATSLAWAPLGEAMPFREMGPGPSGCKCRQTCQKRESQLLRCLLALSFLVMLLLALTVLYLLSRRVPDEPAEKEIPVGKMPDSQRQYQYRIPPCNCCDANIRPSIHAAALYHTFTAENCVPNYPNLYWYNVHENDECQINLDKEGIYFIIPKDGRYYVYSQVTFDCFDDTCNNVIDCGKKDRTIVTQMISHQTSAYDDDTTNIAFISSSSVNKTKWIKTLYLAGIIQLKKGDKLMVNVSNPALVRQNKPEFTFFGAYLIS